MYAVTFDIDTNCLNDYGDIRKFMEANNFIWQQGSVYFGNEKINAVNCVLTIQKLAKQYSWFMACVKDVRMLRIEENNNLIDAIQV